MWGWEGSGKVCSKQLIPGYAAAASDKKRGRRWLGKREKVEQQILCCAAVAIQGRRGSQVVCVCVGGG